MKENMTKKNQKKKYPIVKLFSIAALFMICWMLYGIFDEVRTALHLNKELSQNEKQRVELEKEQAELNKEIENLENPEYVKRYARGKYMVSKPGEQIFKLPSEDADD